MASIDLSSVTDEYTPDNVDATTSTGSVPRSGSRNAIHGRSKEIESLLEAYQYLLTTKQTQIILIHGESGSGKTALVDTLRYPVCDTNGYFVAGKYFQDNATVQAPYSAIMAALSDLCDLVIQSNDFDDHRREIIVNALGANGQLLIKSISNITPLLGANFGSSETDTEQPSFAKFKVACKTFLRTMSSPEHPIVIFLDDMQWADEGSIQLLRILLQDNDLENVMFIVAYREEASAHVVGMLDVVRCSRDIALSNLETEVVYQLVIDIMGPSSIDNIKIRKLSDLVERRTRGNPLHVRIFMEIVKREGLLEYSSDTESWDFDIDRIQEDMMASNTLAGLLMRKIERLPNDCKAILKVASLVGYSFGETILEKIACSANELEGVEQLFESSLITLSLSQAIKEGIIEKSSDGYQFTHDRLQSAFCSLVNEPDEGDLHLCIGVAFLTHDAVEQSNLYKAAVHLNCAPGFLHSTEQRARLAKINLKAAKYCVEVSAFDNAVVILQTGLHVLGPENRWSEEYFNLTFEMMEVLARTQLIVGNFDACKETTRIALCHGKTAKMNVNLLLISVEVRMAGNEVGGAIFTANQALNALGIKMPRKTNLRRVLTKLVKVKFMLRCKSDDDLLNLPSAHDSIKANAVKLLMHVCSYCLLKDEVDVAIFSALLATELTLKNGFSQHSPCAFAIYGVAEVFIGNIDRAYRFGKLALAMLDRMPSREAACPTVALALTFLTHRKELWHKLVTPLIQVADLGFQHGDIVYASYCASQSFTMHVYTSTHLGLLEESIRVFYDRICDLGQDALLGWLQPVLQCVLNMRADVTNWDSMAILSGEIMNEEDYFNEALETNHMVFISMALLWKAKLAVEFGQFSLAASIFERCESYNNAGIAVAWSASATYFEQALLQYGMFELSGRRRHLRKGRNYKQLLQRIHHAGCPNASPFLAFLIAHESALGMKEMKESTLRTTFENGIRFLAETKDLYLEALLSERAGFIFASRGLRIDAEHHFDRALYIYQHEWGATAKFNQLQQTSAQALIDVRAIASSSRIYGRSIAVPVRDMKDGPSNDLQRDI